MVSSISGWLYIFENNADKIPGIKCLKFTAKVCKYNNHMQVIDPEQ